MLGPEVKLQPSQPVASAFGSEDFVPGSGLVRREMVKHPPHGLGIAIMQRCFAVTAPSVHQMVLGLERQGLLRRHAGRARSLEVLVAPEALPVLR